MAKGDPSIQASIPPPTLRPSLGGSTTVPLASATMRTLDGRKSMDSASSFCTMSTCASGSWLCAHHGGPNEQVMIVCASTAMSSCNSSGCTPGQLRQPARQAPRPALGRTVAARVPAGSSKAARKASQRPLGAAAERLTDRRLREPPPLCLQPGGVTILTAGLGRVCAPRPPRELTSHVPVDLHFNPACWRRALPRLRLGEVRGGGRHDRHQQPGRGECLRRDSERW